MGIKAQQHVSRSVEEKGNMVVQSKVRRQPNQMPVAGLSELYWSKRCELNQLLWKSGQQFCHNNVRDCNHTDNNGLLFLRKQISKTSGVKVPVLQSICVFKEFVRLNYIDH